MQYFVLGVVRGIVIGSSAGMCPSFFWCQVARDDAICFSVAKILPRLSFSGLVSLPLSLQMIIVR
jgi:hypothetical protein